MFRSKSPRHHVARRLEACLQSFFPSRLERGYVIAYLLRLRHPRYALTVHHRKQRQQIEVRNDATQSHRESCSDGFSTPMVSFLPQVENAVANDVLHMKSLATHAATNGLIRE